MFAQTASEYAYDTLDTHEEKRDTAEALAGLHAKRWRELLDSDPFLFQLVISFLSVEKECCLRQGRVPNDVPHIFRYLKVMGYSIALELLKSLFTILFVSVKTIHVASVVSCVCSLGLIRAPKALGALGDAFRWIVVTRHVSVDIDAFDS